MSDIIKVVAVQMPNQMKYQYWGITVAGMRVKIRLATRLYTYAFQYSREVGPGQGDAAFFSYGQKPSPFYAKSLVHRFNVVKSEA